MLKNSIELSKNKTIDNKERNSNEIINKNLNIDINKNVKTIDSYCYLPPIDKKIKDLALQKPTSILNKFITKHARDLISNTERCLIKPIALKQINKKENNLDFISKSQKQVKSEEKNLNTIKLELRPKKTINNISLGVLLKNEKDKNQKKFNINNNEDLNVSEDNDLNINDLYNKYNNEIKKMKKINSISRNRKIPLESAKKMSSYFRRICSFQPEIKSNWKYMYGLKISSGGINEFKIAGKDIFYQSKIIDSHYKLLFNDINYYTQTIMQNKLYLPSFESLSLTQKINYNKSLEETIGILMLLPKLLLNDFYDLIKNSYGDKIPKEKKFEDKYIFDEVENLKDNNKLFFEIKDYFEECYKIFHTVIKEFNNIIFKANDFNKIITCFEKARYNISYINNSSENAFDLYNKDIEIINRIKGKKNKILKDFVDKMRENYSFGKNKEKQKKIRINNSLTDRNNEKDIIKTPYRNSKVKSIVNSRMINNILKYCRKDSKLKLSTERINNEIDGENGEDYKINGEPHVIRMNLI